MILPATVQTALQLMANRLGVAYDALYKLIKFESKFNPTIKNPYSSARGLIQFTNATAKRLGFKDSADLVKKYPTVLTQLPIVEKYLAQFKPFSSAQSLYMSVFYPKARNWNPATLFPEAVRKVNPGIKTVSDYVRKVEGGTVAVVAAAAKKSVKYAPFIIAGGAILIYVIIKNREDD